ncbi:MAG: hypoxanthine phosphoribosyltransferase [Verrucomicrobiota bacterium JB024]|nr:hypoxanthine phosphoribosyltransferase [Verrucomicrobiota bacterium JB024]
MLSTMENDLARILVSEEDIRTRIRELGAEITRTYRELGTEEIAVICITNGSIMFAADLLRQIDLYAQMDCIRVCSYQDDVNPVSEPEIVDHIRLDIGGQHVLLIDDILDTGRTLDRIVNVLQSFGPQSLRTCVLLDKEGRREVGHEPNFAGFTIPNEFVVGYGLDFAERYRNLGCIGVLKPELQNPPEWC